MHRNLPPANSESVLHPRLARDGQPGTTNSTKNDRGHGGCGVLGIKVCISTSGIFGNNAGWCASSIWYKGLREIIQNPLTLISLITEQKWFPVDFPLKEFEHSMIYDTYIYTNTKLSVELIEFLFWDVTWCTPLSVIYVQMTAVLQTIWPFPWFPCHGYASGGKTAPVVLHVFENTH